MNSITATMRRKSATIKMMRTRPTKKTMLMMRTKRMIATKEQEG